jgi:hypothetical protein
LVGLLAVVALVYPSPPAVAQVATGSIVGTRRPLFNPADFVAPPPNTYGNSGRGILYAPGHVNFDTSLSKRFRLVGDTNAEFRWDAFNLFNHPAFGFPNASIGNPNAGRITTTIADNRSMQFALKVNF